MTFKLHILKVIKHKIKGQTENFYIYGIRRKL